MDRLLGYVFILLVKFTLHALNAGVYLVSIPESVRRYMLVFVRLATLGYWVYIRSMNGSCAEIQLKGWHSMLYFEIPVPIGHAVYRLAFWRDWIGRGLGYWPGH